MSADLFEEEVEYLFRYAEKGLLYFVPLWDSAETVAGRGAPVSRVREVALELIGALIDRGVRVGDVGEREDRDIDPWDADRETVLARVDAGMRRMTDPTDLVYVCGFRV
ncbi:hypothetical protein [Streptomyces macrosporus]|uniref:hypothetical protein n=1 Tax=Streptomyces macrosporus TaxID=44032 RepID=UPI0031D6BF72